MMVGRLIRGRQGAAWALQAVLLALCVSYTVGVAPLVTKHFRLNTETA